MKEISKIAGVTFNNEECDGGENRQELLKKIYERKTPCIVTVCKITYYNKDTEQNEKALKVKERATGKILGYIPRKNIELFYNMMQKASKDFVLYVRYHKNTYSGSICEREIPTDKQYRYMKYLVSAGFVQTMPEYDLSIYRSIFKKIKTQKGDNNNMKTINELRANTITALKNGENYAETMAKFISNVPELCSKRRTKTGGTYFKQASETEQNAIMQYAIMLRENLSETAIVNVSRHWIWVTGSLTNEDTDILKICNFSWSVRQKMWYNRCNVFSTDIQSEAERLN